MTDTKKDKKPRRPLDVAIRVTARQIDGEDGPTLDGNTVDAPVDLLASIHDDTRVVFFETTFDAGDDIRIRLDGHTLTIDCVECADAERARCVHGSAAPATEP